MTREELHNIMQKISYDSMGGSYGKEALNKYLDDLESRTCENCKYCIDDGMSGYVCKGASDVIHISNIEDFGCTEFKRKEK